METPAVLHPYDGCLYASAPQRTEGRLNPETAVGRALRRARCVARKVAARLTAPKPPRGSRRATAWTRYEAGSVGVGGGGLALEMWRADDNGAAVAERQLQARVFDQFANEPLLDSADIRVEIDHRTVTLSGTVKTYLDKVTAERAAQRLSGVGLVCNRIAVVPPSSHQRSDSELVEAAAQVLEWNVLLAHAELQVTVIAGWIRLAGELGREWERCAAEESVERLVGVKGVRNLITVRS